MNHTPRKATAWQPYISPRDFGQSVLYLHRTAGAIILIDRSCEASKMVQNCADISVNVRVQVERSPLMTQDNPEAGSKFEGQ